MEYKLKFSVIESYGFLKANGLEKESDEIKNTPDKFKDYTTTLRRAKIIVLVEERNLFDSFCKIVWPSGLTERGKKSGVKFYETLYKRWKADPEATITEEEEEEIAEAEQEFAYENDLRNYLVKNLSKIENGLKLYEANGVTGVEFIVPNTLRRIDILAIDKNNNYVVIELKAKRGYDKVVGQALFYQSSMRNHFQKDNVRAIIVANKISPELRTATQYLSNIELLEYQLSVAMNKVK